MVNDYNKVDIGNVRGIQGEKGERGERGYTPSYDDLKYQKQNDEFITLKTNKTINLSDYYLDAEGNLCNSEGYLYNENKELTTEKGISFDETTYGYEYYRLWIDADGKFTNEKGEILDENGNLQYVKSSMISDIVAYMYEDEEAYNQIVSDIYPEIVKTLINADLTSEEYKAFFDAIEGDIKYYICEDNPRNSIVSVNGVVENTCKYYDEKGILITDTPVPLEKNALYLYKDNDEDDDNSVMHYDIYLCLESGTVPKNLVSSSDFVHNYNVIDNIGVKVEPSSSGLEDEKEVILKLYTRGTRGQFYSMGDVDKIIMDNLINKLGAVDGIAQLNNNGKVPSSQLPAFVDDVIEGTMNNGVFNPTDEEYIGSVEQSGKIYVDKDTRKTYRWSGSNYIYISNPVVVDDGTENAYASVSGKALETKIGTSTLNTTEQTITGAINEHETDINTLNSNKQYKIDNDLNTANKTVTGAINEINSNKVDKITGKGLSTEDYTTSEKNKLANIESEANKITKTSELTNDSGFLTSHQDITGKLDKTQGTNNNGKFLKVGVDGNVTLETVNIPSTVNDITDNNTYINLGTSANATQSVINSAIDAKFGNIISIIAGTGS